jgi:hypothetical protein
MNALLPLNRLQRKVVLVIGVIIVVPMLITGWISASWIAGRMDESIEHWIREAAQVNKVSLDRLHENSRLFSDVLEESTQGALTLKAGQSPVPTPLWRLANQLGINLVQLYDYDNRLIYSCAFRAISHGITGWCWGRCSTRNC